mgnify:CR=1 FL=1
MRGVLGAGKSGEIGSNDKTKINGTVSCRSGRRVGMIPVQTSTGIPNEPTPYPVLERLANSGYIRKGNTLLDYGCGKGRVDFFLSWQTRCRSIGIEYDERIYEKAVENQNMSSVSGR